MSEKIKVTFISLIRQLGTIMESENKPGVSKNKFSLSNKTHKLFYAVSVTWWILYIYIVYVSSSPDVTPSGWLGSKHQLTNLLRVK